MTGKGQFSQIEAAVDMIRRSREQLPLGPAMVSWTRILLLPACLWSGLTGRHLLLFWLAAAAAASDYFDGWLARRIRRSTTPGKILDMLADKLFLSVMLIYLSRTGTMDPALVLIPAWYHIIVVMGLLMVSWSIGLPVVAITTSERLTVILSYILVVTAFGVMAFPEKTVFAKLSLITMIFTPIASILGIISYFRFSRRLIQRYMK